MDLLEYQAKELFQQIGIPILPAQTIHHTSDLKRLQIPYPIVLKSQVRAGGRGKAGGVRFAENTIDAIAATSAIFHLPIAGEYPEVVLAEARYDSQREIFLAIVLDYQRQCPVLLGSNQGGMDVESLLTCMQQVILTEDFSPFHARRLAITMGLKGELVPAVSDIIEKMYHLFITKDLDLIEINPLGINADGAVMALDGKITINDSAYARHPELPLLKNQAQPVTWRTGDANFGQIGLITSSYGMALSSWDSLQEEGGTLAGACILTPERTDIPLTEQFKQALAHFRGLDSLQVILINCFDGAATLTALAQLLEPATEALTTSERTLRPTANHLQERSRAGQEDKPLDLTPLVLRLPPETPLPEPLQTLPIYCFADWQGAIAQTLALTEPITTEKLV